MFIAPTKTYWAALGADWAECKLKPKLISVSLLQKLTRVTDNPTLSPVTLNPAYRLWLTDFKAVSAFYYDFEEVSRGYDNPA
jgi:hypothetical protein